MIYIFYRPNSEQERPVLEFTRRLDAEKLKYKLISMDERVGVEKAEIYDIWEFPAVMITGARETPLKIWTGKLPLLSEVTYTARM